MDSVVEGAAPAPAATVIEPPAGAGVPVEPTPPTPDPKAVAPAAPAEGDPKPVVKLPASIKPPAKTGSGRFQQRISDLVGQRDTAQQENIELRRQLANKGSVTKPGETVGKTGQPPAATASGNGLSPDQFETYEEYIQALVMQTVTQREDASKSAKANASYEEHKQERKAAFDEQAAPLAAEFGDGFWEAITDPTLPISEAMADAVMELDELGPFTMLWLAGHKDEAAKIARMNPRAATIAIGKLAAKLDYEIKKDGDGTVNTDVNRGSDPPIPTGAPAPVAPRPTPVPTPRGAPPQALNDGPSDKDDIDTWLQKEAARMRRNNPTLKVYGGR